ncbi:hypothetical protein FRC04_008209 [Tulasnella sp. 424]|nr:hypothetical protein FRC04_008209 [Tulasnella sp. 424]KAG8974486.1 hypothetical protein FRC05_007285 [Tulasnella sp. 425]
MVCGFSHIAAVLWTGTLPLADLPNLVFYDHLLSPPRSTMKADSTAAINDAVGTLSKSICPENGVRDKYLLDPVACTPLSVTEAQDAMEVLETTLATLENSLKPRLVQARKRRNAFLPINRLPVEVVVEIFHTVLDTDALCPPTTPTHLERLKTLASVFSVWRSLVSGTPSLWAVLESTCPPSILPTVIRKAKGCLLNIRCLWWRRDFARRGQGVAMPHRRDVTAFLHAVIPLAQKWATLHLEIPVFIEPPAYQIVEAHLPSLRRASVRSDDRALVANPFGGATSQLKELRLHEVSIDWASVELKGLSALVLKSCRAPSISHLLAILEHSPGLQALELKTADPDITDAPSTIPIIVLPHLKDLALRDISHQATLLLLQSIHTPRFRTILIAPRVYGGPTPFPDINYKLEHLLPAMRCALNEAKTVNLKILESKVNLMVSRGPDDPCFKLCWGINGLPGLQNHIAWLQRNLDLKTLSASGITAGSVHISQALDPKAASHHLIFEWIPNITELVVYDSSGVAKLIQSLTERVCDGNKAGWRCPRLRKVEFRGFPTPRQDVFEFARRRYGDRPKGDAVNQDGETTIRWPDKLECLNIKGVNDMDYEAVEELKDITGCELILGLRRADALERDIFGGSDSDLSSDLSD